MLLLHPQYHDIKGHCNRVGHWAAAHTICRTDPLSLSFLGMISLSL